MITKILDNSNASNAKIIAIKTIDCNEYIIILRYSDHFKRMFERSINRYIVRYGHDDEKDSVMSIPRILDPYCITKQEVIDQFIQHILEYKNITIPVEVSTIEFYQYTESETYILPVLITARIYDTSFDNCIFKPVNWN